MATRKAAGPIHTSPSSLTTTSSSPSHGTAPKRSRASARLAGEELEGDEGATRREEVAAAQAERARAVVEDGEAVHGRLTWTAVA